MLYLNINILFYLGRLVLFIVTIKFFRTMNAFIGIILFLNFDSGSALKEREEVQWKMALALVKDNPFGIGVGRVTPGSNVESYIGHLKYFVKLVLVRYGYNL